jgi:hypothetical protein
MMLQSRRGQQIASNFTHWRCLHPCSCPNNHDIKTVEGRQLWHVEQISGDLSQNSLTDLRTQGFMPGTYIAQPSTPAIHPNDKYFHPPDGCRHDWPNS